MTLKELPPNFKPFYKGYNPEENIDLSEFKVCLRIYEVTEHMCYSPDESNNILQMKTTFGKVNPRNKTRKSTHSCYDYKSANYNYNNYQKPQNRL